MIDSMLGEAEPRTPLLVLWITSIMQQLQLVCTMALSLNNVLKLGRES
jgi:hypothetical protein